MSTTKNRLRITFLYCLLLLSTTLVFARHEPTFSLMLDPAGDAQHTGRKVDDSFERGVTLQFAEELKKVLEQKYPALRIVLTRFPGETVQPLQNATFANRLSVDLYVSLHCYQEASTIPTMSIYYLDLGDEYILRPVSLALYRYDQAHLVAHAMTQQIAKNLAQVCDNGNYRRLFSCKGPFGIPLSPLIGVLAPAIALDCGVKTKADWRIYIDPLVAGIGAIMGNRGQVAEEEDEQE